MLFFFYGTLVAGNANAVARSVQGRLVAIGPARTSGLLYGIEDSAGWYPALVAGEGVVWGQLYAAAESFSADDLSALDGYENCDPMRPDDSDYERLSIAVTDEKGMSHAAQAYRWQRPLPADAVLIGGGDFARWLGANGYSAYAG